MKRRRIITLIITITSCLVLARFIYNKPAISEDITTWKTYTSDDRGYSFLYPPELESPIVDYNGEAPVVNVSRRANKKYMGAIIAFSAKRDQTEINREINRTLTKMPNSCKTLLLNSDKTIICRYQSYQVEADLGDVGGGNQEELFVHLDGRSYNIMVGNLTSKNIEQILMSYRIGSLAPYALFKESKGVEK